MCFFGGGGGVELKFRADVPGKCMRETLLAGGVGRRGRPTLALPHIDIYIVFKGQWRVFKLVCFFVCLDFFNSFLSIVVTSEDCSWNEEMSVSYRSRSLAVPLGFDSGEACVEVSELVSECVCVWVLGGRVCVC